MAAACDLFRESMDLLERQVLAHDNPWLCGLVMEGLTRAVPGAQDAAVEVARLIA